MSERLFSVKTLNEYVAALFAGDPLLRQVRVQGEISGFKRHSSGHLYFSLKDEEAVVRCVMFRQNAMRVSFLPKDGMKVVLSGSVSLYVRDGAYQVYVQNMQQAGQGELYLRYLALKERMEREGYFDPARKKPVPALPRAVGIVTSGTGAAVQDILQIIGRRFPKMNLVLCPVKVQGEGAAEEIARAIRRLNAENCCDVIICGRGGGSIEDLWAFNEPAVARAIYESRIPVISAVGHETDFTIADFVADLRAPTPSAAAELAVPEYAALRAAVDLDRDRLERGLTHRVERMRAVLIRLAHSASFFRMEQRILGIQQTMESDRERMERALKERLRDSRSRIAAAGEKLSAMNPEAVLERGYTLIRTQEGRVASSAAEISPGDRVELAFRDGTASAEILTRSLK